MITVANYPQRKPHRDTLTPVEQEAYDFIEAGALAFYDQDVDIRETVDLYLAELNKKQPAAPKAAPAPKPKAEPKPKAAAQPQEIIWDADKRKSMTLMPKDAPAARYNIGDRVEIKPPTGYVIDGKQREKQGRQGVVQQRFLSKSGTGDSRKVWWRYLVLLDGADRSGAEGRLDTWWAFAWGAEQLKMAGSAPSNLVQEGDLRQKKLDCRILADSDLCIVQARTMGNDVLRFIIKTTERINDQDKSEYSYEVEAVCEEGDDLENPPLVGRNRVATMWARKFGNEVLAFYKAHIATGETARQQERDVQKARIERNRARPRQRVSPAPSPRAQAVEKDVFSGKPTPEEVRNAFHALGQTRIAEILTTWSTAKLEKFARRFWQERDVLPIGEPEAYVTLYKARMAKIFTELSEWTTFEDVTHPRLPQAPSPNKAKKKPKAAPDGVTRTKVKKHGDQNVRRPVSHLDGDQTLIRQFLGLTTGIVTRKRLGALHAKIEKAIVTQRVRKTSPHADLLTDIAALVKKAYAAMTSQQIDSVGELKFSDSSVVRRARTAADVVTVRPAVPLLSRFINLQGHKPEAKTVAALVKAMDNAVAAAPSDDYAGSLQLAVAVLKDWKPGQVVRITQQQLSGLNGLPGLGCPGETCGCSGGKKPRR